MAAGLQQASTSEVNSWPIGMPAKRTRRLAGRPMANEGLRGRRRARRTLTLSTARRSPQQLAHLARLGAVVERGDQLDRVLQALEVGLQLGLDGWRRA
jgi:hypothetical protein